MDLATLSPQSGVVTGGQKRRPSQALPLAEVVMLETSAAEAKGRLEAEAKQRKATEEAELTRHKESLALTETLHLKDLGQREQESAALIAQRKKEARQARGQSEADRLFTEEQAGKANLISGVGVAIQGVTAVANLMGGSKVVGGTLGKIANIAKGFFSKLFG